MKLLLHTVLFVFFGISSGHAVATATASALVIGNQSYSFMRLETPENDAQAMADKLQSSGFDTQLGIDLKQVEMYQMVDSFFANNEFSKFQVIYYAGHAVQMNGKNFLIPIDLRKDSSNILSRLFDINYVIGKFQNSKATTKILILDSCRDTLFSKSANAASGLAELKAPPGTLVAFSTMPGATAEDGEGDHSPYTEAMLNVVFQPGIKIEDAFKEVRKRVMQATNGAQIPTESSSLLSDFVFNSGVNKPTALSAASRLRPALAQVPSNKPSSSGASAAPAGPSVCGRLMTKLSIGLSPLTAAEKTQLAACH